MRNEFSFDLQRFDGVWKIADEIYSTFTDALAVIAGNSTISLTTDSSEKVNGTIPADTVIDLGGNTCTITDGALTLGDNVTFTNGTLNIEGGIFTGNLNFGAGMTVSITGGNFSNDVSAYLAENFSLYQIDETYTVIENAVLNLDLPVSSARETATSYPITIPAGGKSAVIEIGGVSKTIISGATNAITVSTVSGGAVVTLSNPGEDFYVNDDTYRTYKLNTAGSNGIVLTLGSGSAVTVGSLDKNDVFSINDEKFSITALGVFSGYDSVNTADKMILGSLPSTLALTGSTPDNLSSASTTDWYKIVEVDKGVLNITGASDFDTLADSSYYKGVIAVDTDGDTDATRIFYAELSTTAIKGQKYMISSITSASVDSSLEGTLSNIYIASDVLSGGVVFTENFAASSASAPTITTDNATFHVDSSEGYFVLSGGTTIPVSLNSSAKEISLIRGSLTAAVTDQTVTTDKYTISSYTGGTSGDGIELNSDSNGNVTLGDLDVGESFYLTNGSVSSTYTMTKIGLVNNDGELLLRRGTYSGIKESILPVSLITNATEYTPLYASEDIVSITGNYSSNPTLISCANNALASLTYNSSRNIYNLSTDYDTDELDLGNWAGIYLSNSATVSLSKAFIDDEEPLRITTGNSSGTIANFAITSLKSGSATGTTLTGSSTSLQTLSTDAGIAEVRLFGGSFVSSNSTKVNVSLSNSEDIDVTSSYYTVTISSDLNGATMISDPRSNFAVGRASLRSSATLITDSDGTTSIVSGKYFNIYDSAGFSDSDSHAEYSSISGNVTFIYDTTNGGDVYATDLQYNSTTSNNDVFQCIKDGDTITYTMVNRKLQYESKNTGGKKVWINDEGNSNIRSGTHVNLNDDYFRKIISSSGKLTIPSAASDMDDGETVLIVAEDLDLDKSYGTLTKTDETHYNLNQSDSDNYDLSDIVITDSSTVNFSEDFYKTNINLYVSNKKQTSLRSETAGMSFAVSGSDGVAYVTGANEVSLISGTILTDDSSQTIWMGNYSVSANPNDTVSDGLNVVVTTLQGSVGTFQIVNDIDYNESFIVNGIEYNRGALGLTFDETVSGTTVTKFYKGDLILSGSETVTTESQAVGVILDDLFTDSLSGILAAAESGIYTEDPSKYVFAIGGEHSVNALVVDDLDKRSKRHADLQVSSGKYVLTTVDNSESWANLDAISVVSGVTTISSVFTSNADGELVTIMTAGSSQNSLGASFFVTKSKRDIFTLNGQDDRPTIGNATALTLLDGVITATNTQTITIGEGDTTFHSAANMGISFDKENSEASLTAATGNAFTVDGDTYSVVSGNGMDFFVGEDGGVTVEGLTYAGGDVFTYNDSTYYLKSTGFVKKDASNYLYRWDKTDDHSLAGGSVAISDLETSGNWQGIVTITNDTATVVPSRFHSPTTTLMDKNFKNTYGTLEFVTNGIYSLSKDADDSATLSAINITSKNINTLSVDEDFEGLTISYNNSSVKVGDLKADSDDFYQVSISGGIMGLSGVATASLISGSLLADSNVGVSVSVNSTYGTEYIRAGGSAVITLMGGTAAVILDQDDYFSIGTESYTLGKLGLANEDKQLLVNVDSNGKKFVVTTASGQNETIGFATIANQDNWCDLLAPENGVLTISSALELTSSLDHFVIVNDDKTPDYYYGKLTQDTSSGGYSLETMTGADSALWPTSDTILVDSSVVTLSSDFQKRNIAGVRSEAAFVVNDSGNNSFTVADTRNGAIINDATKISQTDGTIIASARTQTITAGSAQISNYNTGDSIKVVVDGDDASIAALNNGDIFLVNGTRHTMATDQKLRTANELFRETISGSVAVSDLVNDDYWYKIISTDTEGALTISSSTTSILSDGDSAYIINGSDIDTIYGSLTRTTLGGYSLSRNDDLSQSSKSTLTSIVLDEFPLSLTSDFKNIPIISGKTTLQATTTDDVFALDYDNYVEVFNADGVSLGGGTLKTSDSNQTIRAGSYRIHGLSFTGSDSAITVIRSGSVVKVGELNVGERFVVGKKTYRATAVGLIEEDSWKICDDDGYDIGSGVFTVDSNFERDIIGVEEKELNLSSQAGAAVIVDDINAPTARIADLDYDSTSGFTVTRNYDDSLTSIALGTNTIGLTTKFNTTVRTTQSGNNPTFTVNKDRYKSANAALTIQSGSSDNNSSLISGAVVLDTDTSAVKTSDGVISSVSGGELIFTAAAGSVATLSGLNNGDKFAVNGASYSVTGAGLLTETQIWTPSTYESVLLDENTTNGLLNTEDNWDYIVAVSNGALAIPPTGYPQNVEEWIILSEDLNSRCGTLKGSDAAGYTLAASSWDTINAISINKGGISVAFPSKSFRNVTIEGADSGATFRITDNKSFTVTDGINGASITNATRISQSSGTIALTDTNQTITTSAKHSINAGNEGDGITVIIDSEGEKVGALSIKDTQDTFTIDNTVYEMLPNGSIHRPTVSKFWTKSILEDDSSILIDDLQNESYWGGYITISGGVLKITRDVLGSWSSAFVVDENVSTKIYGTLSKSSTGYTLNGATAILSLSSIEVLTEAQPVSLTSDYVDVSIKAGSTYFKATEAASGFKINYTSSELTADDATAITLLEGDWTLKDANQVLTADGQVIQVGGTSSTISVNYDGANIVNVTGIDAAGEIVSISGKKYELTAGDGISVNINDSIQTVNDISEDDDFSIANDRFIKKEPGFIKSNSKNYLWTADGDVTAGISVAELSDNDENWSAVATVASDEIVIDKNSSTAILIDSVTDLSKIYGSLTVENDTYTLTNDKNNGADPALISINNVVASLTSDFAKVPINAAGASFAVTALTSGNKFSVDATDTFAVVGNASKVSLTSGTLADLTKATTVTVDSQSVAAGKNSTINVGFDGSEITFSELDNGESFSFDKNTYTYKNVGVVKGGRTLFVNDTLDGSVTDTILEDSTNFKTMFSSDGATLTLQSKASGVFVDSASTAVSAVYAIQDYDSANKIYSFAQIADADFTIDAATLTSGGSISAPFEAKVLTPSTGTFNVNGRDYIAAADLTIDTTEDSSTLNKGTVSLKSGGFVDMTNVDNDVSVVSGDGLKVSVENGSYTLGGLNKNDVFAIGGYSYTMKSNNFIVREDAGGNEEIYISSVVGGALAQEIIDEPDYWNAYVTLDSSNNLNLNSTITGGIVISKDFLEMFADLTVNSTNNFNVNALDGADTSGIKAINLTEENSTLTTDFAATVKTASGSNTYTINDNPYTAKNSALEISATKDSSTITKGIITLNDSTVMTTSNHTISGSVDEINVASMKFTPSINEVFSVDGQSYTMTAVGLTKGGASIWTKESDTSYILPDDDAWSNMASLSSEGVLNLRNGAAEGSTVIINSDGTKRMASLIRSDNTYTLNAVGGNSIAAIQLGDSTTDTLTLTADFDSDVKTGNGVYKVNGLTYKGNGLTIKSENNSSALYGGTVNLSADEDYNSVIDYTNGYNVTATGGDGINVAASEGTITNLTNLNSGDTFIIDNVYYKVLANQTFVQTETDGTPSKLYENLISGSSLKYSDIVNEDNFVNLIGLEDGVLDLTQLYGEDGWSAVIVADKTNPINRVAKVSYSDAEGYKLETTYNGDDTKITSIKLGSAVTSFSTTLDKNVNTTATVTYTINDKLFTAQDDLTIVTADGGAILTNGTVSIPEGENYSVTTRRINSGTQTNETIQSTSGTVTVNVDNTSGTVTIGGLNANETFTVDGTEYTVTNIGLLNEDKDSLNASVADTWTVATTDLSGSNWRTILSVTNGALDLTSNTPLNVSVVDISSYTNAFKYGFLTYSGGTYTLTQDENESALSSITITGTNATFGAKASGVPITSNGATFSVTATDNFTINAASTSNPPAVSDTTSVTGIYLSAGTISAPADIPITANGKSVTATSGDMTVTNSSGTITVEGLNSGETFTVDGVNYKVTTAEKLFDITDEDEPQEVITGFADGIFTIDNAEFMRIITLNGSELDLKEQTSDAYVYDNLTDPTVKYAALTVTGGKTKTLTGETDTTTIQTINIAENDNLTVDFDTRVHSEIGNVIVNTKSYSGTTELVIDTDGTTTNSTLYNGTINLNTTYSSATDFRNNTLERTSGKAFTATATNGRFTEINNLDNEAAFTYGGKTYTQSIPGLIIADEKVICTDILANETIALADLTSETWIDFRAPVSGVLDISALDDTYIIYDDENNPTKQLATFTVASDGKKTLADHENNAASEIEAVEIAAGDVLAVDFVTKINSPIGEVTVNDKTYSGTTALVIDSATDSEGEYTSTLYNGTITLDRINSSATDSKENTLTREGGASSDADGTFTATAENGRFTIIEGLDPTESFTYRNVTYVQSEQGLRNGAFIRKDLAGTTINLSDLSGAWSNILAPVKGVLDISEVTEDALVYDSATNPTTQLATFTVDSGKKTLEDYEGNSSAITKVELAAGDDLTIDFATKISSPIGTVAVNGNSYVGTTALEIDSVINSDDTKDSTLTNGTVSLAEEDDFVKTTGGSTITYTTAGDGMTVKVDNSDETEAITFDGLTLGDTFSVGEISYRISEIGPVNSEGKLWHGNSYTEGITLAAIETESNWTSMLAATNGALSISENTLEDGGEFIVVDNLNDPTKIYGDLTKSGDTYKLTRPTNANDNLSSINASGIEIELANNFAGVNLVANISEISDTTLINANRSFTLDATDTTPSLSNISSLTLNAGTIYAAVNQTVTAGNNVITPSTINGDMIIGLDTISGIVEGDIFTLGEDTYKMTPIGLVNDTDSSKTLVTNGIENGTLTVADIEETPLIAVSSAGMLNLSNAVAGDSIVVDSLTSPENIYGALNKAENIYTLYEDGTADGIKFIAMPDADSTLTTDIAAEVDTNSGSNTYIVNSKKYIAADSSLAIDTDGTTTNSTLTDGKISLAEENDSVETTGGTSITYTADGDGMTVAVDGTGETEEITFDGLTFGDTFTIGEISYKVSAVGPINSDGKLWNGNVYTEGITLAAINTESNWTPMLVATNGALTVNANTLVDGDEYVLVDSTTDPTKVYGDLAKEDGKYTLTKPSSATDDLSSISVSGISIEIAPDYAGIPLLANDSNFSDITLSDEEETFTLDATNTTPSLSNVSSLTLNAGTIYAAENQTVTVGENVILPTAINSEESESETYGKMTIGMSTISGIDEGESFTVNGTIYKMLNTGLFNDTDNKLVTEGFDAGEFTFGDFGETRLIEVSSSGALNLSNVFVGDSIVVDKVESPANIYGSLNRNGNAYTLEKEGDSDGIKFIAMPDADSTLTTDISATVNTPSSSNTYTVNGKEYSAADSALVIDSNGTTSTLTDGKISLAEENDTVSTTGGTSITYTADGDGMTVAVDGTGETEGITFDGLTLGDTFTIGENSYKVSAVGPINSDGALWNGNAYTEGITLAAIDTESNWTPMFVATNGALTVNAETLADGEEFIIVDNLNDPTKIYGDLTKADGKYTLTRPTNATDDLSSISVSNIEIELANDFAGVNLVANASEISDTVLTNENKSFTLDATNTTPSLSNISSLTLNAGTIFAAENQTVTVGETTILPTAINAEESENETYGKMTIGLDKISGIDEGESFTVNGTIYKMLNTGLFNDTDNKLVTEGFDAGEFTFGDFGEIQLIEVSSSGALNLSNVFVGDSIVVDKVESPANIYGSLNRNGNAYTLEKEGDSDGIKFIAMPDADSTLTTDISATVNTPSSSNTYTVNGKEYSAANSALVINSEGTTSTLTDGKISLAEENDTVTTTGGNVITYTTDSDGMTVAVDGTGETEAITFDGLTLGDTFKVGENSYKVSAVGPINSDGELWNGNAYTEGITLAAIDTESNWTPMFVATNGALTVNAETLADGEEFIVVDNLNDPTKIYGDLTKTDGKYTLTRPTNATDDLSSISVSNIEIELANDFAGVDLVANASEISDTVLTNENKSFTLNATNTTPSLSNVSSLTLNAGTIYAAENQTVTVGETTILPTSINAEDSEAEEYGKMTIGLDKISGIDEGESFTVDETIYKMLNTGLFNDTDNKLVTEGFDAGEFTFGDFGEIQLIEVNSAGMLNLSNTLAGNSLVVDKVESPANIYGKLNRNGNVYTLDKEGDSDGIKSVTMPNSTSTLTTDISATVNTPSSSNTYTVNGKDYSAADSALVINSDGTTSTLTNGKISLAEENDSVTTTSGSIITYKTVDGDGMTVQARTSGNVTLGGLTSGDAFKVGDDSYRVTDLGFHNGNDYLWTSNSNFKNGVSISDTGTDGLNNSDNWTRTVVAEDGALSVKANTLGDGESAIIINSSANATATLGTLTKTSDGYTLTTDSDDEKLSSISVAGTKLTIAETLADVPVSALKATFTVTAEDPFTVDATGDNVSISEDATAIEISKGTITATTAQTVTATEDSGSTKVIVQDNGTFNIGGEEFLVADNQDDLTFGMTNGVPDSVDKLEKDAKVTIDGITYTAPEDGSTLKFAEEDGWYFDGYIPSGNKYNLTVDGNGNITVDAGVKFTDVVASGKTLPSDGVIKLAADINNVAVNVTNNGSTPIAINDKDNNPLVENLGRVKNVTFDEAGVMVEKTSDVAGALFTIDVGKSLETETATVTSNANDCEVGIGSNGTSFSIEKSATVDAPVNTALTLGKANYTVNGVEFSASGTAQASITSAGVKVDLVLSDVITYEQTDFDGTGTATADIDKEGGVSLTSGASVAGAAGKALNISGTITLEANTIEAATATDVTAKAAGIAVANDDVTVTGDDNGYKVNIAEGKITGLEKIGGSDGVTLGGLSNGTIKTDKVGAFTVADRTFTAIGDASVTYGIEDGKISYVNDVDSILSGDFSDGLEVNGGEIKITGENVSLRADSDTDREILGMKNNSTLTTAEGVTKVEPIGAGKFTFGDHTFETDDSTISFNLLNSSVRGIDSLESGNLIISQDENNLAVNDENISLEDINSPVTLGISDSDISSIYGLNGGIAGLDNATVFGLSTATVNGKFFDIEGDVVNAIIVDGDVPSLYGLDSGATVKSAPNINARTTANGTFIFRDDKYNINDTLDGVVVFSTNINSYVTNIGEFEGSISGNLEEIKLNDKDFNSSSDKVTVANDGTDVIAIHGLSNGDTISGSLSYATYLMPEGTLTVNEQVFILRGDDNGVSISGDGQIILGLDKDASLTVAKGGDFSVNSNTFDDAPDGTTFIAGRDGVYIYDPNNKPIHEITPTDDIIKNLIGEAEPGTISLSGDSAASVIASGELDSPMALTLDNATGASVQVADFSNSKYAKRVTLLGGDQDIKFNDEGKNAAHVAPDATGRKNIELGDGGDVAVNDSPYAKVSIKTGKGADTIVNRKGASSTVDVKENGDTTIVPTSGRVTLQNYDEKNNAKIRSFEYVDMIGAIKSNEIKFGDGLMTLGDAVVVFDPEAKEKGGTFANLVDYAGEEHRVGFTHTDGGVLNASTSGDDLILKGNYAEKSSDTTKSGASTLIGGRGDDTILAGEGDYIRAGAGDNQIYLTDENLRGTDGAIIVLGDRGRNTVHNFNDGYTTGDAVLVSDISALKFTYDSDEGLVMRSGNAWITFDGLEPAEELVTFEDSDTAAPYELKITDGKNEYNVAVAQEDRDIGVDDFSEANVFYGNKDGGNGLNFSEYSGTVEVNMNLDAGRLNGEDIFLYNINKLQAGNGDSTLIGKAGEKNTLLAGEGNGSMWSAAGRDLMVGNTSDEKDGSTMFYFMAGDGRDTIEGFNYMSDANDYNADVISLPAGNIVTNVLMQGDDIVMQINASTSDYLRLQDAVGNNFKLNDRVAKVDTQGEFDNLVDFYVVAERNATMNVGADVGNAQVWLDDKETGEHGIIYKGEIKYLDASNATGNSTLVGNDLDNVIYGGEGSNSIWGGFGANNDTLIGGNGHNVFFFGLENGRDTITSINSGDIVYLANGIEQIAATTITSGGTKIELTDGSSLEIMGNAEGIEYHLQDGSKYTADHGAGQWNKK